MSVHRIYNELSEYYPYLTGKPTDEIDEDISDIKALIKDRGIDCERVIDVGCGVGQHLHRLEDTFSCIGVDSNVGMVQQAQARTDTAHVIQGDMQSLPVVPPVDVVLILFGTLGYAQTEADLRDVLSECYRVLGEGGMLIIEHGSYLPSPEYEPIIDTQPIGYLDDDITIQGIQHAKLQNGVQTIKTHYLVAKDGVVTYHEETHHLTLRQAQTVHELLEEVGFKQVTFNPDKLTQGKACIGLKEPTELN